MRPPCEMVQKEYLPLVRTTLAKNLAKLGHSQNQIADSLGITQAAVSKYLSQTEGPNRLLPFVENLTTRLATEINDSSIGSDILVKEVCAACMSLRIGSELCSMHKESIPLLGEVNCQICSELLSGDNPELKVRAEVLDDMQNALRIIQQSNVFAFLVPQVRANLVVCDGDAEGISEVAGIPGRITIIEGKARVLTGPRFGASKHTASLLLEIMKSWLHVRACLCISGKPEVVKAAKSMKVKIISLPNSETDHSEIAKSALAIQSKLRSNTKTGIHVPGGVGVEPILYIFGVSATELSELCEDMGEKLKK